MYVSRVDISKYDLVKPVEDVLLNYVKIDHSPYQEEYVLGSTSKSCTLISGMAYALSVWFRQCNLFLEQIGKNIFFAAMIFGPPPMDTVNIFGHQDFSW